MFARTTMTTDVSGFVLSLVTEYGGGALRLVRKGWTVLRGLFGRFGAIVRPLLKEGLAALSAKLATQGAAVREKANQAGSALLRLAKRFIGQRPENEPEPTTSEIESPRDIDLPGQPATDARKAPSSKSAVPIPQEGAALASTSARTELGKEGLSPSNPLQTLGPIVGRALVRALSQPRGPRPRSPATTPYI